MSFSIKFHSRLEISLTVYPFWIRKNCIPKLLVSAWVRSQKISLNLNLYRSQDSGTVKKGVYFCCIETSVDFRRIDGLFLNGFC